MIKSLRRVCVLAISVAVVAGANPQAAGAKQGYVTATPPASGSPAAVHTVTLVTGDVIQLSTFADGRQVATVDYRRSPHRNGFQLSERDGDLYVVPHEALPYVASGRVDEALFNITDLVADGYHDAARSTLPLLIAGEPTRAGGRAAAPSVPAGATRKRELRSIGAVAVTEDKARARDFWKAVAPGPRTLSREVGKVWLDRRVRADLTDSVPQIGAPTAWRAGYDGTGVKVAVLDSGYDAAHPDLAGRVAASANFTIESDTVDRFGHGTHVAATIAGSGTAGRPGGKGVAPGAQLLVGKVLDQSGSGDLSWVIAGMEWAVEQGARVINVSLGGQAFEGPDPATEAVDALTARSGALFVISAGNSGPGLQTIGTPGTASSALTVGAVSKQDEVADFSSRGPRLGDGVVKPEITAPGVGIIAARAAGTTLGEVVDASYTSMSGTSMAAPHVTGAAALLAQKHPDWRADQLKATLVSSAKNPHDAPVWEQGAGRVDIPAALNQEVRVDAATISFGSVPAGSPPKTATVTYRNPGVQPVDLNLAVKARDAGATAKPAALTVTPARLTVPARGQATATVRLDAAATTPNLYAGMLTARGGGRDLRTPVGLNVTPPVRTLTIEAVNRDGHAADGFSSRAALWNLDTGNWYYGFFYGGPAAVELPAGRYALMVYVHSPDEAGFDKDVALLGDPELTVDSDRTVRYDARDASELHVETPEPTSVAHVGLVWQRTTATRSFISGESFPPELTRRLYVAPTRPVATGTFQFFSRWDLIAPPLIAKVPGAGGFTLAEPRPLDAAPLLDGQETVPLVDGGNGTPGELAQARDAAVLLRYSSMDAVEGQLRAANAAGARVVFLAADTPGYFVAFGSASTIPAYAVDYDDARRLRDRLAAGSAEVALTGHAVTPYRYDLLLPEPDQIPIDLHYDAQDLKLATVETEFHQHAAALWGLESRAGFAEGVDVAFSFGSLIRQAHRRTDHVNTQGVAWRGIATVEAQNLFAPKGTMFGPLRTYQPGERASEVWFPALTRPAVPDTLASYPYGVPVNRAHDTIRVAIPQYADGSVTEYGWVDGVSDRARLTLRHGNKIIGQSTGSSHQFTVPASQGAYRLTLDVTRDLFDDRVWWTTSTATSTTWTFRSRRPNGDRPTVLPLPQIGYDIDTDLSNAVRADRPYPLVLRPGYQPGAAGPGRFHVDVAVSYDDGVHWQKATTRDSAEVTATIPAAPAGSSFATIRVIARDAGGNKIEQTITRAWKVIS